VVEPLAVDIRLIRSVLSPGLKIVPGRALMARVVAAGSGRGSLSIAGIVIQAELPANVRAGQDLRLVVREVSAQRVLLSMSDQPGAAVPAATVALPGGGTVHVTERDEPATPGGGPPGTHRLALRYDAPTLGPIDLRLELDPTSLRVGVTAAAGEPFELAGDAAEALREALREGTGRAVGVTVSARHEPLDVYA
jgi:hypothetical protein